MSGIYLHIPFCKKACHYCNFHFSTSLKLKDEMISAMTTEIDLRHEELIDKTLHSIYFGGGTPSLLAATELNPLFNTLSKHYLWDKTTEITLEANPDDITLEKLKIWKSSGINRLSIGIQSFLEEELKWMNRAHTAIEAESCVKMAQDIGFDNITIDLIYGSPFCNDTVWNNNIHKALELKVPHISAYNLTVEENTALSHFVKTGTSQDVDTEKSEKQFLTLIKNLESSGFIHYEISNFGHPGFFAVHNSNYWKGEPYLGIGPSAHSYDGTVRKNNIAHNPKYIAALSENKTVYTVENLDIYTRYNETIMIGLRTIWGVNLATIEHISSDLVPYFLKHIQPFILNGWVHTENKVFTLTRDGKLWADKIAVELFWVE